MIFVPGVPTFRVPERVVIRSLNERHIVEVVLCVLRILSIRCNCGVRFRYFKSIEGRTKLAHKDVLVMTSRVTCARLDLKRRWVSLWDGHVPAIDSMLVTTKKKVDQFIGCG